MHAEMPTTKKSLLDDADKLMRLIDEALVDREKKRVQVRKMEQMALGSWSSEPQPESPENLAFAMAAFMLSSMPSRVRSRITSDGDAPSRMFATAAQGATNQVLRQQKVEQTLKPARWDYAYGWCASFCEAASTDRSDPTDEERATLKGTLRNGVASPTGPAMPSARLRPEWASIKYLHPDRYFHDTKARVKQEWEFQGHSNVEAKEALLERSASDDTWDRDAILALETTASAEALSYAMARGERTVDREKVLYYVVYLPGAVLPDRPPGPWESGVICTVAPRSPVQAHGGGSGRAGVFLRKAYYHKGHPAGPYVHAGQYIHTEDSFPVTALLANSGVVHMLNAAASSLFQRMREHTVKHAFDARLKDEIETLKRAADGAWIPIPNLTKDSIQTVESGGPTIAEVNNYALLQGRAAANLAMDDAHRGSADPDATATAIREASMTVAAQQSERLDGWRIFLVENVERIVAHIAMSDRFFVRLDEAGREDYRRVILEMAKPYIERMLADAGVDGELTSAEVESVIGNTRPMAIPFVGGDLAERPSGWYELNLEIRVESADSQGAGSSQREQHLSDLLDLYGDRMVRQPHIGWKQRAAEHFAAIGAHGMERLLDEKRASALVQMQLLSKEPVVESDRQIGGQQEQGARGVLTLASGQEKKR